VYRTRGVEEISRSQAAQEDCRPPAPAAQPLTLHLRCGVRNDQTRSVRLVLPLPREIVAADVAVASATVYLTGRETPRGLLGSPPACCARVEASPGAALRVTRVAKTEGRRRWRDGRPRNPRRPGGDLGLETVPVCGYSMSALRQWSASA
jgi:hypothetical protein